MVTFSPSSLVLVRTHAPAASHHSSQSSAHVGSGAVTLESTRELRSMLGCHAGRASDGQTIAKRHIEAISDTA
jgi:hypothetical protein